jgi:hypothetical protein
MKPDLVIAAKPFELCELAFGEKNWLAGRVSLVGLPIVNGS